MQINPENKGTILVFCFLYTTQKKKKSPQNKHQNQTNRQKKPNPNKPTPSPPKKPQTDQKAHNWAKQTKTCAVKQNHLFWLTFNLLADSGEVKD